MTTISRKCKSGSTIYSDEWAAHRDISQRMEFTHSTANHSINFVNPDNNVYTQHIESYWAKQKQKIKNMKGIKREKPFLLLSELI